MQAHPLDTLTRTAAALSIGGYQKYLSPYKGFGCAHRVLHRGRSCSEYTKCAILERGVVAAMPLMLERFRACKVANERLQHRHQRLVNRTISLSDSFAKIDGEEESEHRRQRRRDSNCSLSDDLGCCGNGVDCVSGFPCDCYPLDCPTVDCGAIDCAGLDCSGCDGCGAFDCAGCSW